MTSHRKHATPDTAPALGRTATTGGTAPAVRLLVTGTGDGVSRRRAPNR